MPILSYAYRNFSFVEKWRPVNNFTCLLHRCFRTFRLKQVKNEHEINDNCASATSRSINRKTEKIAVQSDT